MSMDLVSILIASIILCFFLGNYFYKYKEESKKNYLSLRVYISSVFIILMLIGLILKNNIIFIPSLISFSLILIQEIVISVKKLNEFCKDKKGNSTYMCSILSIRGIVYLFGSPLLVLQHLLYALLGNISK